MLVITWILAVLAVASASDCGVDITFVMDESESVTEMNWPQVRTFVHDTAAKIASRLGSAISASGTRVGLVTFNDHAKVAMYLDESTSQAAVKATLDSLVYFPGLTNINDGLETARTKVLTAQRGDRADIPNIVVLVSDGVYTPGTVDPAAAGEALRNMGATVISVGINGYNGGDGAMLREELIRISGDPKKVFTVDSFDGLFGVVDSVAATVPGCKNHF